jgi:hypothetical protein
MSLESVEEFEAVPPNDNEGAPPPRRRSLSKLKRRLSRTFRLSFSGSLTDFGQTFSIAETAGESEDPLAEDVAEAVGSKATASMNGKSMESRWYRSKLSEHDVHHFY